MPLALRLFLIALWGLFAFLGYRRGLFASLKGLARLLVSVGIPALLCRPFAAYLDEHYVYPLVYDRVSARLHGVAEDLTDATEEGISQLTDRLPPLLRPYVNLRPAIPYEDMANEWSHTASQGISDALSMLLAFALLFAVTYLLVTLLLHLLERVVRLPVIRTADRALGLLVGGITGFLAVALMYGLWERVLILLMPLAGG